MAKNTNISYRDLVFYQIFVRQFSKEKNFLGVIKKLDYLKSLNVDVIQLLPIHPIGLEHRKGSIGSPYSIRDYYKIDEMNGTMDEFKLLLEECHKRNIKVVMDMVFNHTSHDAEYAKTHPDWYYHNSKGDFCNRVGDWWDIIDFNFTRNGQLKKELTNVLLYWTKIGVDGYRCDVAPLIPMNFWNYAIKEVKKINKKIIMISESVHLGFIKYLRDLGFDAYSDSQMFDKFDICYDYDIYDDIINYVNRKSPLCKWIDGIIRQESTYPKNYVKLRYLENHDFDRINKSCSNKGELMNLTGMMFFLKGAPFIYNGQECGAIDRPNLFEIDLINWDNLDNDLVELIRNMTSFRKNYSFISGIMNIKEESPGIVHISYSIKNEEYVGYFNLTKESRRISISSEYEPFIVSEKVDENVYDLSNKPLILIKKKTN